MQVNEVTQILTLFLCELMQKTRLANAHVTNDDVFKNIRVIVRSSGHALSPINFDFQKLKHTKNIL